MIGAVSRPSGTGVELGRRGRGQALATQQRLDLGGEVEGLLHGGGLPAIDDVGDQAEVGGGAVGPAHIRGVREDLVAVGETVHADAQVVPGLLGAHRVEEAAHVEVIEVRPVEAGGGLRRRDPGGAQRLDVLLIGGRPARIAAAHCPRGNPVEVRQLRLGTRHHEPGNRLAGDLCDHLEVLVQVQDGEPGELGGGSDEEIGYRRSTVLFTVCE